MSPLAWLRSRTTGARETRTVKTAIVEHQAGEAPLPRPVLTSPEALRAVQQRLQLALPSTDLEGFADRLRNALCESGITIRPKLNADECLCCIGRYSTCRNPNR